MQVSDDELLLLSYYRTSEINGSLFFGRLARVLKPGPVQHDLSKHFADEAAHAWYWTECIDRLGARPAKLAEAYQDQFLETAGLPANLMEVLAITLVFEARVINQYRKHANVPGLHPEIAATIERIMADESWHVTWVRDALASMEDKFGKEHIDATIARNRAADQEVYEATVAAFGTRLDFLDARTGGQE